MEDESPSEFPSYTCNFCGFRNWIIDNHPKPCLHCRDEFAKFALSGILTGGPRFVAEVGFLTLEAYHANTAYKLADAMMLARITPP